MYFSICLFVVLTLVSIPCDAQFGLGKFEGGFPDEFMNGFAGMGMGEGGMGGMGPGDDDDDSEEGGMGEMRQMNMGKFGGMGMGKMGSMSPLIANEEETEMCKSEAEKKGMEFERAQKVVKKTCEVVCHMKGDGKSETVKVMSPKDTLCCDMVGVGPTGKCNGEGICNAGGMDGMGE